MVLYWFWASKGICPMLPIKTMSTYMCTMSSKIYVLLGNCIQMINLPEFKISTNLTFDVNYVNILLKVWSKT